MTPDVFVIGAGPGGCAAARMLASFGHRVLVTNRPAAGRHSLAESIPPSVGRLLAELGMQDAVEAAGFHPWLGNTVWWGSDEPRAEPFAVGEAGYQVERARFDAVLRNVAANAGAEIVSGVVRDIDVQHVGARIILDCSGRAGVIARKGYRQPETSHRTVALAGVWRASRPWPPEQRGHTLVAAHADGWAWSVPTAEDVRYFTVMVDPERSRLTKGAPSLDVYFAELRKVSPFLPWLDNATLIDGPWGADASLYSTSQYTGPDFLLVGDAASFIDPLSSFGVKKALASGWLAAITANTILKTPAMADEARAFYERHERGVVESFKKQTARYAVSATEDAVNPFWEARQFAKDPGTPGLLDPDTTSVLDAFTDLRRRPEILLRRSDHVSTAPRAAIRGHVIVMDEHLFLPTWPAGVRYLRNVDLLLLMRLAPEHRDVGELYEAVCRAQPGVSLPDFLGALSTLVANGALTHAPQADCAS